MFFRLILKNARFGFAVKLHGVMPVQMIRSENEEHADVRAKSVDEFELKAAQLHDRHRVICHARNAGNQRSADVAGEYGGKGRVPPNEVDQGSIRGLSD